MKKVNLLLVDDDPIAIITWKRSLEPTKYEISEARSSSEALDFIKKLKEKDKNALLVVLLDVLMPGENGIGVLKKIKTEFQFSKVYVITGNTAASEIPNTAFDTGSYGGTRFFLKQNLNMDELLKEVEKGIKELEREFELKNLDA